jgi:hypothetical protein
MNEAPNSIIKRRGGQPGNQNARKPNSPIPQPKLRGAPFGNQRARKANKRVQIRTTVSQETFDYIKYMRSEIPPGQLVDAAIKLYRELTVDSQ